MTLWGKCEQVTHFLAKAFSVKYQIIAHRAWLVLNKDCPSTVTKVLNSLEKMIAVCQGVVPYNGTIVQSSLLKHLLSD